MRLKAMEVRFSVRISTTKADDILQRFVVSPKSMNLLIWRCVHQLE